MPVLLFSGKDIELREVYENADTNIHKPVIQLEPKLKSLQRKFRP